MSVFYINGTAVASPSSGGVSITDTPIWSSNTGRATTGKMTGDIIAWKTTIEVTWGVLSFSEAKQIYDVIKAAGEWFPIKYYDFNSSSMVTKTVYVSDIPRKMLSLAPGMQYYTDVTISFIEQ